MSFVIPSSLFQTRKEDDFSLIHQMDNSLKLRMGVVIKVHEIEDETNLRKIMPEYDVLAINDHPTQGLNTLIYEKCWRVDGFGGIQDYFQAKLKPDAQPEDLYRNFNLEETKGSIVLLLCLDGSAEKAIIIGALANPSQKLLNTELGHHMEGQFNGVNWQVNKDGELIVKVNTPPNEEGEPTDAEAAGTNVKIDRTGAFELNVSEKEFIKVKKVEKTVTINAESDIIVNTEANVNITATENIQLNAADLVVSAQGRISFNAASPSAFTIDGELTITPSKLKIDAADGIKMQTAKLEMEGDQVTIKSSMVKIDSSMIMLGSGGTPALVATTQFIGVGNLGAPVVSQAVGPFSSSVMIGS